MNKGDTTPSANAEPRAIPGSGPGCSSSAPQPPRDRAGQRRWRAVRHWHRRASQELQRLGGDDLLPELDRLVGALRERLAAEP